MTPSVSTGRGRHSLPLCSVVYRQPDTEGLVEAVPVAVGMEWEIHQVCSGKSKWVRTGYLIVSPIFLESTLDF